MLGVAYGCVFGVVVFWFSIFFAASVLSLGLFISD